MLNENFPERAIYFLQPLDKGRTLLFGIAVASDLP